jgi:hypothetical protein
MVSVEAIREFVSVVSGGDGSGYGGGYGGSYGDGSGYGDGDGYGDGRGGSYGDGDGYGYGYGSGYGDGDGSGYGDGDGGGYGYGDGDGGGYGYGDGSDIKTINGIYTTMIDTILTAITNIRGNIVKGFIVNDDLTLEPCYVVKQDNLFSHGKTIKSAMAGLRDKLFEDMSEEERIDMFWKEHNLEAKYPASDFYEWHHRLTGSCEIGRQSFCKDHNIDLTKDKFTVKQFVELCKYDYGGEVISKLLRRNK